MKDILTNLKFRKYLDLGVAISFLVSGLLMLDIEVKSSGYILLITSFFFFVIFIKNTVTQHKAKKER